MHFHWAQAQFIVFIHSYTFTHAPVVHKLLVDRDTESTPTTLHLKQVFHEYVSTVSATESQRTQSDKDLSGNLIMMKPVVDIVIFAIHIRTQQQMTFCSNLAAAAQDSWFTKSKSVWAETELKMSCSCNGDVMKGFTVLLVFSIDSCVVCQLLCGLKKKSIGLPGGGENNWCSWFGFGLESWI